MKRTFSLLLGMVSLVSLVTYTAADAGTLQGHGNCCSSCDTAVVEQDRTSDNGARRSYSYDPTAAYRSYSPRRSSTPNYTLPRAMRGN